jgi:hypothetical protein
MFPVTAVRIALEDFVRLGSSTNRISRVIMFSLLLCAVAATAVAQDVSSSPTSLSFGNTYVGLVSGSKTLTISNLLTEDAIIASVGFSCPEYGLASGVAPFTLTVGPPNPITHYSVFFQPDTATTFNCNFVMSMWDGTNVNVPVTGTGLTTTATTTISPTSLKFTNQSVGTTSAPQTVTVTNNGGASVNVTAITLTPPSFTIGPVTLPFTIAKNGGTLAIPVSYTPSQVSSSSAPEVGAIDITYNSLKDNGADLSGNGVAPSTLVVATSPILPQATQTAAYQTTLTGSGGTPTYQWRVATGSTLPAGLTLSSAGVLSGTLASSVAAGTYTFSVQLKDKTGKTIVSNPLSLTVYANLGDNCADLSFNVPNTTTHMVSINDLGTGTYQGSEGGLYPSGSNVRPAGHDADGVTFAQGIQPLDSNGNPSPTGKYVLLALGESTLQNEFNRFLPIANSDPQKNPNLVIVNGAQGGATPNDFSVISSYYWGMVLNNYLPQNGVTSKQVVAAVIEDTDGIATGTFPTDIATLQTEYESMMNNMHTLFPNLKLVYFSSRVYGGYSNGVGSPDNPEPYAYEVGFAVKWAIQDQLNGNANLNYNPALGAVKAPWMSWGSYYWSNGMLGRKDGLQWDCADFSADGTHPASTNLRLGQLKVATQFENFLKTDDTTVPWYLASTSKLVLTATGGSGQSGNAGSILPTPLTVLATNNGTPVAGVTVAFSDGGVGGTFGTPNAVTNSSGVATTTYTLPSTPQNVAITATSSGYSSASFTETATSSVATITVVSGGKQSGTVGTALPLPIMVKAKDINGVIVVGAPITFSDGLNGTFSPNPAITGSTGQASTTYTLPTTAKVITVKATDGSATVNITETSVAGAAKTLNIVQGNNQTAHPNNNLAKKLIVSVLDQYGNGISGVTVNFTDNGAGGILTPPAPVTTSNGQATTGYTTGPNTGSVTIDASTSTLGPAVFTETVN